jgi:hypothetical protein
MIFIERNISPADHPSCKDPYAGIDVRHSQLSVIETIFVLELLHRIDVSNALSKFRRSILPPSSR